MTGTLFHYPRLRAFSASGDPVAGARLYAYRAGTSVLAPVYTSAALTVAHANPVSANGAGEFPAIYLDPAAGYDYKFVCQTVAGAQLWAEDNIPAGVASTGGGTDPGTPGGDGLSVAEVRIYQRAAAAPATPSGGSFNFATQSLSAPDGWSVVVPAGSAPLYVSTAVAAAEGSAGIDTSLAWSAPVIMAQDGSSVDIVFQRSATQPATPAPSPSTPTGWYTDVDSVPASADKLWSSIGTRDNASQNWIWQVPIQVEGDQGPAGTDASLYYIRPTGGTAIKNGAGSLTVEARRVFAGNDVLLSSGTIKLYVGTTEVTEANGYAVGSNGYTGVFDAGDISGAATVTLKDGPSGDPIDTITLVDIADGEADTGSDAVYGFIEPSNGLAFVRASDGTTWTPAATSTQLDISFVQGGAYVARVAWVITRDADGILTGAPGTHTSGDLNGSRVNVVESNESTQAMTIKAYYSFGGDTSFVGETVLTSVSASGVAGDPGDPGANAIFMTSDKLSIPLFAYQNGLVPSYTGSDGYVTVWDGPVDATPYATITVASSSGVTGAVVGPDGHFGISSLNADNGYVTIQAVFGGVTMTLTVHYFKQYAGYEIVTVLPNTNLFAGRVVFLTTDSKLYRYTGSSWTRAVDGADLTVNSVTSNAIQTGAITAAKISVTSLSTISANAGTITAGVLQSPSGGVRHDLSNARVIYNSAPGQTGGTVRVQGGGFGPGGVYLDWYGPKPAGQSTDSGIVANLTDAAASYYLKTSGEFKSASQRIRGEFEPKAWGCINADTDPATINDRYNIASVDKPGSGLTRIFFAEALANANYACCTGAFDTSKDVVCMVQEQTTSYVTFRTVTRGAGSAIYPTRLNFVILGSNVVGGTNVTQPSGGTGGGTIGWGNLPGNYILP